MKKWKINICLQKLKNLYFQKKIIMDFRKKKIFEKWKTSFEFNTLYFPYKFKIFFIKKRIFNVLKNLKIVSERKKQINRFLKLFLLKKTNKIMKIFLKRLQLRIYSKKT